MAGSFYITSDGSECPAQQGRSVWSLVISSAPAHVFAKVGDGNPLKLWKASVEVEAPPSVVLNRVLRERHLWDEDFVQWKVVETLDRQTEVYQYVLNSMAPHPSRDFVVLR